MNGAWNSYAAQQQQQQLPNMPNRTDIGQTTITLSNMSAHQTPHTPASAMPQQIPPAHSQSQIPSIPSLQNRALEHQQQQQQQLQQQQSQSQTQQQQLQQQQQQPSENIVRVFDELMRNISKMKMFVRPSMCKPYGKQSESLQKSKFHEFSDPFSNCFRTIELQ